MSPGLLRQPGCFEGLLSAAVIVESHALAVLQRPHRTIDTFDIDATLASPGMNAENGDDALTSLDELLRIPTPAFPAALPVGLPTKQSFQPPVLTRLRYVVVVDLNLRVESFKGRFQVAAYVRVVGTAHDLHVLLRHRLLPQPGGFEGLCLGAEQPIAHELAASNRGHLPVTHLYLGAAVPAAPIEVGQESDLGAPSDALVDLGVEVREAVPEAREVFLQSGDSFISPVDISPKVALGFDLQSNVFQRCRVVAPVPGFHDGLHQLHVLLRHSYSPAPRLFRPRR